jgi:hypothetical protein
MGERDGQAGVAIDAGDRVVAASTSLARTVRAMRLVAGEAAAPVNSAPRVPIES